MEKKFKAISDFVTDLNLIFPKNKEIAVYLGLLDVHKLDSKFKFKHLEIFKTWLSTNSENVINKTKNFKTNSIKYSDRAQIDMKQVLSQVEPEDEVAIWQHLLTMNYLFFPSDQNKTILKSTFDAKSLIPSDTNEGKLIENALEKVTSGLGDGGSSDPSALISNLLTSGAIGDIMTSMNSGNIDPKKLIGIAQNMLKTLSEKIEE